jgi:hypothetical protein
MNSAYYEALMQVQQQTIAVIRENALYRDKDYESSSEVSSQNLLSTVNVSPQLTIEHKVHLLSDIVLD